MDMEVESRRWGEVGRYIPYVFNAWRLLAVDDPTIHMGAQGGEEDAHLQPSEVPGGEKERERERELE